jgi:hypothetical protein
MGRAVAVANGGVVITGVFQDEYADFGNIRVANKNGKGGGDDIFVTRLDGNGIVQWAVGIGSTARDIGRQPKIAANHLGEVFIAGALAGQANLGPDTLPPGHFVSQINAASGQFVKSWSLGAGIQFRNINTDSAGNLWVTGLYEGQVTFPDGTTAISTNSSQDAFLMQFSNSATVTSTSMVTTATVDEPSAIKGAVILNATSIDQVITDGESTWTRKSRMKVRV